ncbi:Serpin-ZX [Apostasia shenzhenica]|uniref:Serpin-ZX n=1 Tax=Apostasia shenzhenica TaxID=1088818 RepID=A0A2H9ZXT2_9ASPA|nr:Serpin-ZX [Apostasia shenzhenica]
MDSFLHIADLQGLTAAADGSNFVFSPVSLRLALSFTAAGARGETLQELLSFLGSLDLNHLHSAADRLISSVSSSDRHAGGMALSFVNALWVDRIFPINPSFAEVASSIYRATAESVDFVNQAPLAIKKINDWVKENTNGIINNIISNNSINPMTRLVITNALYFKGKWENKFDISNTNNGDFHLLDRTTIQVPFMTSREDQFITSCNGFKALRLPYLQENLSCGDVRSFSMLLFLPAERDGLPNLIKRAVSDPEFIENYTPRYRHKVRNFMVPKFKFSSGFEASSTLKEFGVKAIFGDGADLGEMSSNGDEGLLVSRIEHKAAVEVDEEGTTAAAVTAVTFMVQSVCFPPVPVDFVADHPFMKKFAEAGLARWNWGKGWRNCRSDEQVELRFSGVLSAINLFRSSETFEFNVSIESGRRVFALFFLKP